MENIRVYSHSACLSKENGDGHPERKERLESILDSIKSLDTLDIDFKEAPLAEYSDINHVHPQSYLEEIFEMIPNEGLVGVEKEPYADTILCQNSKEAILRACGAGISASRDLMEGNLKRLFCAVRPPGHHAETARVNGFCFINNVAVAARYLQSQYDIKRVAIIDFDVHHGNGTQEIFYNDESVLYGSIHQHPLFPGTGLEAEKGVGNIFNAPIDSGTTSEDFLKIFNEKILQNVDKFKPEVILISAGFDAHKRDPLAAINLDSEDYFSLTQAIVELANRHSSGRVISFLEGGYDLLALSESTKAHFKGLSI
ncbi:MAG: histone deacetylase family protein [Thiotrichales bacterium]|jgi:acetoin utilization deacetylase AcuC-like enzyme|nr:histone deacetylase family protein [Thiotrichales bacterium]MBT3854455.1 histone deacetylase family protein [Thiotrichales bacterium]MBT4653855.1 histone deacetylase family protein [Thiotrichales bacterium]MBT5500475.1 histone deacetylase family protein [Thiotrichales bacterium]MBT5983613.1 histone deacetylase family protein [Thiotrichales bacterium]